MPTKCRAIGIIRVSQTKGREGESFASPAQQRERIEDACNRDGLELVEVYEELDVSGGTPLERRTGLRSAIESVEAGDAQIVMAAYFDRLARSLDVQRQVVTRVEKAGGEVIAVDVGQVTHGTATKKLNGTLLGAFAEYQRDTTRERSGDAQRRAVARGVVPWPNIPPGYIRSEDGTLTPHPDEAPIVAKAFKLRADGATVKEVRAFLTQNGIKRSYHGVGSLLASPLMIGAIRFGPLLNPEAHIPIVDFDTWAKVQLTKVPRGRRAKSDRLLARLGVLRCGSCDARMSVGTQTQHGRKYAFYRCPANGDCTDRMAIGAEIAERVVIAHVRAALANVEGKASAEIVIRNAEANLQIAEARLSTAIETLSGFDDVASTRERLTVLRRDLDEAKAHFDQLGGSRTSIAINADLDWGRLTLAEQRDVIKATVARVTVASGRGADRLSVQLFLD